MASHFREEKEGIPRKEKVCQSQFNINSKAQQQRRNN